MQQKENRECKLNGVGLEHNKKINNDNDDTTVSINWNEKKNPVWIGLFLVNLARLSKIIK